MMVVNKRIGPVKSIYEKIWCTESFGLEKPRRFGVPNLFMNRLDWSDPLAHGHPKSIEYKMLSLSNIT